MLKSRNDVKKGLFTWLSQQLAPQESAFINRHEIDPDIAQFNQGLTERKRLTR